MSDKNFQTSFCIICGRKFDGKEIISSKEHIIPEALGNNRFITYSVCKKCNNQLGSNVDCYLTDFIFAKIVRKTSLLRIMVPGTAQRGSFFGAFSY